MQKTLTIIFFFTTLLTIPWSVSADTLSFKPSFDCTKATLEIEKTICRVKSLAEADLELSSLYKNLLSTLPNGEKKILRNEQIDWIAIRNESCLNPDENVKCIQEYYSKRIDALKNWKAAKGHSGKKVLKELEAEINSSRFSFKIIQEDVCVRLRISSNKIGGVDQDFRCFEYAGEIEIADINFDGYKDVMVLSFVSANRGYTYWLFDPKTNNFNLIKEPHSDEDEILWNPSLDAENKSLTTFWSGSDHSTTEVYNYQNGQRVLLKEDTVNYKDH